MKVSDTYVKEVLKNNYKINLAMIKKDLVLSYILKELSLIENLVFKGGTCLSKCYLNYHRLSEDLDFNLILPEFESKTEKRKYVRRYLKKEFLPKLQNISSKYGLDFDSSEFVTNKTKYCPVKNSENIFRFLIYCSSEEKIPIKIEININEKNLFELENKVATNLNSNSKYLTYPLNNFSIKCYSLEEIIIEKIRAIITRPEGIHERDIFDLFLINNHKNIFDIDLNKLHSKIKNSFLYNENLIFARIKEFEAYQLFTEIENLALIEIDKNKYIKFAQLMFDFIKKIIK